MSSKTATRVAIALLSCLAMTQALAAEADIAEQLRVCVHPAVNYADVPGPVLVVDYHARVDANGNIESLGLKKSSGDAAFDTKVAAALRQCSPFPPVYTAAGAAVYPTVLAITYRSKEE